MFEKHSGSLCLRGEKQALVSKSKNVSEQQKYSPSMLNFPSQIDKAQVAWQKPLWKIPDEFDTSQIARCSLPVLLASVQFSNR